MARVEVIFWWHHHQPWYLDPVTHQARLPWVRLHACRGYLDMATAAGHPSADRVCHTFNFVPSLLDQLQRYAQPGATDLWLDLSRPYPGDMSAAQRAELLHRMGGPGPRPVQPLPRLEELRAMVAASQPFTDQDMLDLQVLAHLGFMGATLAHRPGIVLELLKKEQRFTQEEKQELLHATTAVCSEVVEHYRTLWRQGRVEITATPYFHPILPLVTDTDSMVDGLPHHARPPRFAFPQDARTQISRGLARCEQVFGRRPVGMWPSEGSVSPAVLQIMGEEGVQFCGTDEGILYRSTVADGGRPDHGEPFVDPSGKVAMFFRDHGLSDEFGFTYRDKSPHDAAHDCLNRIRGFADARGGMGRRPAMVVILDGENPWERYPNAGREHLLALQEVLGSARDVEVVTPSQHLQHQPARRRLSRLHAGSWVDSTFAIWIGHQEDRQGWRLLGDCRRTIERARRDGAPAEKVDAALEALYPAEGSDWFWWFGEEFQTREADLYDALFRGQIKSAYQALGVTPPPLLDEPIKQHRKAAQGGRGWPVRPRLVGQRPSAVEWKGAVRVRGGDAGSMAGPEGPLLEAWVGADATAMWFCFRFKDSKVPVGTLTLEGNVARVIRAVTVDLPGGACHTHQPTSGYSGAEAAVGEVVTVRWPLPSLQRDSNGIPPMQVAVQLHLSGGGSQRLPTSGMVDVELPPEHERWSAAWV